MKKTTARRATAAVGLAGAAAVTAVSLGAGNAAAWGNTASVPDATLTKTVSGLTVKAKLFDQSVTYARPITTLPTLRDVWASGKISVEVSGGDVKGGKIASGYLVGCQVNFGASAEGDGGYDVSPETTGGGVSGGESVPVTNTGNYTGSPSASGKAGFTLGPGTTKKVFLIDNTNGDLSPDADNYHSYGNPFTGNKAGIAYSQQEFSYDGCAGYAQAKAFVTVKVTTDNTTANLTFYSKPFSLG
ncbi:hypothetical protein GCM10027169_35340 [Gordonia jinhuaensis]|uniref:MspA protein n=1 Tax=Gordonia jinhuaensis TaxID=1517702 RepID=A0A916T4A3_9ACTN|nr:MspA family porin [Gordonia jinhuaensis]GGB30020.1 hypothetical protein GCM10011489_17790 [Gordonia jinhuaensis]